MKFNKIIAVYMGIFSFFSTLILILTANSIYNLPNIFESKIILSFYIITLIFNIASLFFSIGIWFEQYWAILSQTIIQAIAIIFIATLYFLPFEKIQLFVSLRTTEMAFFAISNTLILCYFAYWLKEYYYFR